MTKTCPDCHAEVLSTSQPSDAALSATPAVPDAAPPLPVYAGPVRILNREQSDQALKDCGYDPKAPAVDGERERIARLIDGVAFRPQHISGMGLDETQKEKWLRARNVAYYKADQIITAPPASPLRGREAIACVLYECEKRRATNADSVIHAIAPKASNALAMEPWDECKDAFLSDADAVIALLSASPPEQPYLTDLEFANKANIAAARKYKARLEYMEARYGKIDWDASPPELPNDTASPLRGREDDDWRDDPSSDERWNAGVDCAMKLFCDYLGVDPESVTWDAATETVDGDISAVIGNILRAKYGEDWSPASPPVQPAADPATGPEALDRAAFQLFLLDNNASRWPSVNQDQYRREAKSILDAAFPTTAPTKETQP